MSKVAWPRHGGIAFLAAVSLMLGVAMPARAEQVATTQQVAVGDKLAELDRIFAEYNRPGGPGLVVSVARGGKIVAQRAYGEAALEFHIPNTLDTRFHVASISKQFTAFAIALLEREGKVDLDADVRDYLPYLPDYGRKVTVADLIHHTSGIKDQLALFSMAGRRNDLKTQHAILNLAARVRTLNFEPGSRYLYSNTGYTLLADIVERRSGMPLRQFLHQRVFLPLGMTNSLIYTDINEVVDRRADSYDKADGSWQRSLLSFENWGATSMLSTATDLSKWLANFRDPIVGDAALMARMTTTGKLNDGRDTGYGFGVWVGTLAGRRAIYHSGRDSAFRAFVVYFPDDDANVVITTNTPFDTRRYAESVAELYLGKLSTTTDGKMPQVTPSPRLLDQLAGDYMGGDFRWSVTLAQAEGGLRWHRPGTPLPGLELVFPDERSFVVTEDDVRTRYEWIVGPDGKIDGFRDAADRSGVASNPYQRIMRARPSAQNLRALEGAYRSDELETSYQLTLHDGVLQLSSIWMKRPLALWPSAIGVFDARSSDSLAINRVSIVRDRSGRATGILLSAKRAEDLLFQRLRLHKAPDR